MVFKITLGICLIKIKELEAFFKQLTLLLTT